MWWLRAPGKIVPVSKRKVIWHDLAWLLPLSVGWSSHRSAQNTEGYFSLEVISPQKMGWRICGCAFKPPQWLWVAQQPDRGREQESMPLWQIHRSWRKSHSVRADSGPSQAHLGLLYLCCWPLVPLLWLKASPRMMTRLDQVLTRTGLHHISAMAGWPWLSHMTSQALGLLTALR